MVLTQAISSQLFLFSTHITRTKIIVGVAVVAVLAIGLVAWYVVRRRSGAGQA